MITKQTAMTLTHRQELWHSTLRNADGTPTRCRVNGMCKTWKRKSVNCTDPEIAFRLPVKHGLRECFYIEHHRNAWDWHLPEDCCQCGYCKGWICGTDGWCRCHRDRVRKAWWVDSGTALYQTNCLYTNEGQIVVVRTTEHGTMFNDVSRMIYGFVERPTVECLEDVELAYLHNDYTLDMRRGGVNYYSAVVTLDQYGKDHGYRVPCTR